MPTPPQWRHEQYELAFALIKAILEAARAFESGRLPELFAGFERTEDGMPAPYEEANIPQAWSSAVPIAIAQLFLGLVPDAPRGRCFIQPRLSDWLPELSVQGIRVGSGTLSIRARRRGMETMVEKIDARGVEISTEVPAAPLWGAPPNL